MIKTENLQKVFRTDEIETQALAGVSINIEKGEFVAIMGPSGCGKSTLLNIIGMLDSATDGKIQFLDKDVTNYSERQRTLLRKNNIGFVFQSFNLIEELTVFENVELPLIYQKVPASKRKDLVKQVLRNVQMEHRAKHFPQQLSGGQQQRVAIARAVVTNPNLILADEPTGNLDSTNGSEVMQLLTELNNNGTTVVMVTHSHTDAGCAGRILNLFDGKIISESVNKVL